MHTYQDIMILRELALLVILALVLEEQVVSQELSVLDLDIDIKEECSKGLFLTDLDLQSKENDLFLLT